MPWPVTGSMARHQGEPGDGELIHWIKDRIDSLLGLDPWAIVGLVGALIVLIPVAPLVFYLFQQWRHSASRRAPRG